MLHVHCTVQLVKSLQNKKGLKIFSQVDVGEEPKCGTVRVDRRRTHLATSGEAGSGTLIGDEPHMSSTCGAGGGAVISRHTQILRTQAFYQQE